MKTAKILTLIASYGLLAQLANGQAVVGFDPSAPESNFGAPTAFSDSIGYTITMGSTATDVQLSLVATGALPYSFANLYFDTTAINPATGSDVGFEIENNDTFIPGVPGTYSTAGDGITYSVGATSEAISIPWSFFTTDPQALGFTKISATNNVLRLDLSQTFGYSVAGGSANYGATELGEVTYSTPDTMTTGAFLAVATGALGLIRRRK
jgi:hypothetical protein